MKVKSNTKPDIINIEKIENLAHILLVERISQIEDVYEYDQYRLRIPYRENLKTSIENNFNAWLQKAKQEEHDTLATEIREKRNQLLFESDWTQVVDNPLSENEQKLWADYRQLLRDIPEQEGFPYDVVFPNIKESEVKDGKNSN